MKKIIALTSLIMLAGSTAVYAKDATAIATGKNVAKSEASEKIDMKDVSLIIGHEIGKGFKSQGIDIDVKEFEKGLNSGFYGKPARISEEKSKEIMQNFQQQMIKKGQEKIKAEGEENLKLSDAFMMAIEKLPVVKKAAEGVYYQIIKSGSGKTPKETDTVTVEYTGTTPAKAFSETKDALAKIKQGELLGEEFDSSKRTGKPAVFPLDQVIPCWTEALSKLPVGAEAIIYCSPKTAYGEMAPPQIGPNQVLSFKVNLLKAEEDKSNSDDKGNVAAPAA